MDVIGISHTIKPMQIHQDMRWIENGSLDEF